MTTQPTPSTVTASVSEPTPILFCPRCFASEKDGSWGCTVDKNFCNNCSASGTAVPLPEWAIKTIREGASWIGRRYYPQQEDKENHEELMALRSLVTDRDLTVKREEPSEFDPAGSWRCTVNMSDGRNVSTSLKGTMTYEEALWEARRILPYHPRKSA